MDRIFVTVVTLALSIGGAGTEQPVKETTTANICESVDRITAPFQDEKPEKEQSKECK